MSREARREREVKRAWAQPGGRHDIVIKLAKFGLPILGLALLALLLVAPLTNQDDVSFVLDKDEVDQARERMRVEKARYRGEDDQGQPFLVVADRAVQRTSAEQVVRIEGMAARLELANGDLTVTAPRGRYDIEGETVEVNGPLEVRGPDGYQLDTRNVTVDLDKSSLSGESGVEGEMRLGSFRAGGLKADLRSRTVILDGGVNLKIRQGAVR